MTHHDDLDRELVTWFSDDAARRVPAGLLGSIGAASRTRRQQPGWLVTLRGESMGAVIAIPARTRRLAIVAVIAALAALLAIVIAGQQRHPLQTGLLAFIRNGDVYLAEPDGAHARVVLHQDGFALSTIAWSPTDSRLAVGGGSGAVVLDASTGRSTFVGGTNPVWSPDGQQLAVLDPPPGRGEAALRIVDATSLSTRAVYSFRAIGGLAWSPDGRWIAATGGDGAKSIVRIDVATGQVIQIEGPSGHLDAAREISWSPDSLRVAFIRYGNGSANSLSRCGDILFCRVDVVMADADGANAIVVNRAPGEADLPSWSPDGQWLAFRATGGSPEAREPFGRGIHVVRADGTGERSLVVAAVSDFAWSRDSASVVYSVADGTSAAIWETSLSGEGRPLDVSIDDGFRFEVTGARFGWQIAAVATVPSLPNAALTTPAPTLELVEPGPAAPAELAGTWPTLMGQRSEDACAALRIATRTGLTTIAAELCNPPAIESYGGSLSPSGTHYAVTRDGQVSVLPTNGQPGFDVPELTAFGGLAWSPDGTWLAVTAERSYLLHPDGSSLHEIPGVASWSPDGRTIAVATADGAVDGPLLVGRSDGTGLVSIGVFPKPLTWSPDGSRFGFIRNGDLWTAAIDGSDVRNVTSFPFGGVSDASWSPDGSWVAVVAGRGAWLMGPDGTRRRWLDPGRDQFTSGVVWSPDSSRMAMQAYDDATGGQTPIIYLVNVDGSPTIRIDGANYPSWSPDGRFLVATDVEGGGDPGSLTVMNADGSGRNRLGTIAVDGPLVWLRQ